jgi:hypothetical protein
MGRVVNVGVSAISPTVYSTMVQIPLYKKLVALEIANTRFSDTVGNAVKIPRYTDLSAQTYVPGTPVSATNLTWAFDTLNLSTYKHVTFYVDQPRSQTVTVDQAAALAPNAAYQLANAIDRFVLGKITGAAGFTNYKVDSAGLGLGGSSHREVSASSANIINLFAGAKKVLMNNNVEQTGDWCAVITPTIASYIDVKTASTGFNVSDATLRNGYAGNFLGFDVYISNNLPSGKVSTLSPTISGGAVSATSGRATYFGRKGQIDLGLLRAPAMEIRPCEDKIGSNFITWTVYGATVVTKAQSRGINVVGNIATFG